MAADTKSRVEDIYLPYKPKRRTKAQIAREAGLEPLADQICWPIRRSCRRRSQETSSATPSPTPQRLSKGRGTSSSNAPPRTPNSSAPSGRSSGRTARCARRHRRSDAAKSPAAQKFRDYFDFSEPLEKMPSHRVLAVLRGEKEQVLAVDLDGGDDEVYQAMVAQRLGVNLTSSRRGDAVAGVHGAAWRGGLRLMITAIGGRSGPAAPTRRGGRRRGVRQEPQGPAARGARGHPRDARAGSRLPHGSQGRRRRRHRQGRGHLRDLPAPTAEAVGRGQGHPGGARRPPRRRADRDRQWHRLARNRRTGNRTHRRHACRRCRATREGDGERGRRVGVLGLRVRGARTARRST